MGREGLRPELSIGGGGWVSPLPSLLASSSSHNIRSLNSAQQRGWNNTLAWQSVVSLWWQTYVGILASIVRVVLRRARHRTNPW